LAGTSAPKFSTVLGSTPPSSSAPQLKRADSNPKREEKRIDARGEARETEGKGSSSSFKAEPRRPDPKKVDAAGMPVKAPEGSNLPKIKLRGLPYGSNKKDILSFFKGFAVLEASVTFGINSDGRPSGEAWVSFQSLEEARRAVRDKDRHHMGDRYVELFLLSDAGSVGPPRSSKP